MLVRANDAKGMTKFYTALEECVDGLHKKHLEFPGYQSWIVALTDGASHDTHNNVKNKKIIFTLLSHRYPG